MARIKHTKNELRAQRDALERFERFLPMLQLKKMQLQQEVHRLDGELAAVRARREGVWAALGTWVRLFAEPVEPERLVRVQEIVLDEGNIAGVPLPVLRAVRCERAALDLFATPSWLDDAQQALEELARLKIEEEVLAEQRRRLAEELRTTSQRVNLFEKVKIPETRENIRVIRIFLGDQQTAGVVRAKFAKQRTAELERHDVPPGPVAEGAA